MSGKDVKRPNPTKSNRDRIGFFLVRKLDDKLHSRTGAQYVRDGRGCLRRVQP